MRKYKNQFAQLKLALNNGKLLIAIATMLTSYN